MKVNCVLFRDSNASKRRQSEYKWAIEAYLVMWTVLCFQFHTHRSLQHSKAGCYFETAAELHPSRILSMIYAPQCPLPKLRLTGVHMQEFSQPEGMPLETVALTAY